MSYDRFMERFCEHKNSLAETVDAAIVHRRNPIMYQLAQLNIARMLAPLIDPQMAGFMAQLDTINALADESPGFLWRLQTAEGDATAIRPYEDNLILVNLSLWASLAELSAFAYKSQHRHVMQRRRQWFEHFDGP